MKAGLQFTRKMSIFLSSMLAYIILLSVPIVIGFAIYTQSIGIINKEIKRANDAILTQVQQSLDSRLREVEQLAVRIGLDSRVNGLLSVKADVQITHRYTMHEMINDFRAYIVANPFINSFYVYMKNSDMAIASNASYDSRSLVATWQGRGDKEYKQWQELNASIHKKQYMLLDRVTSQGSTSKMLAYMSPLPIGSAKNPSAMLTIYLNEATLRDVVSSTKMINEGVVLVMNSKGEILFQTEPYTLPDSMTYEMLSRDTGSIEEKVDGHNVVISHISSSVADWVYVTVVPVEVFMQEALNARRMALISFAVCVLLGGFLVFYFIRANYNPVRELIGTITRQSGVSMHRGLNEYRFIQDVVTNIIDEKDGIQRRLNMQELNLRNYHFARIMKGNAENIPFESTCQYYRLDFKSDRFAVILFYLVEYDMQIWKDGAAVNQMVFNALKNAIEELAAGYGHTGVMVEVDDFYACLVNLNDGEDHKQDLLAIADSAARMAEGFGLKFSVAVSSSANGGASISVLYQQALEVIEYVQITGRKQIVHYDEIKAGTERAIPHQSFIQEEQRFVNCLRVGDYQSAKQLFNDMIVGNYLSDPAMPIDLVKCRMFGLVNTTINTLGELSALYESQFFQKGKPVERLLNCHSIHELQQCFNALLDELGRLDIGKAIDDTGLADRAKGLIMLNYQDVNLNVSMLADQMGTTVANLSKQFKKRTGMGLLDYIHRYRLDKAIEMLKDGRTNIRDISRQAGFIDSDAFIRVFKKHEGVTPGKYREMVREPGGKK